MHGVIGMSRAMAKKVQTVERAMKRLVRQTELDSKTGGTGQTILRMTAKPLARLIEQKKIGPEELQAAGDISTAFMSMAGGLLIKPLGMERVDRGQSGHEPAAIVDAQRRYRNWADHWSMKAKRGDPTLEIAIAAVIDERPFHVIEADIGLRHGTAKKTLIRALRDYAARAGWVKGRLADLWRAEAGSTFKAWHPELIAAVARAKNPTY